MRWNGFWFFIIILALLGGAIGLFAAWAMRNGRTGAIKAILWGFVVFFACFNFPIWDEYLSLKWHSFIIFILAYHTIGEAVSNYYKREQWKKVYFLSVCMTILGLVCRYFLEFGEVSNTYNFTPPKILFYVIVAPIIMMIAYFGNKKYRNKE